MSLSVTVDIHDWKPHTNFHSPPPRPKHLPGWLMWFTVNWNPIFCLSKPSSQCNLTNSKLMQSQNKIYPKFQNSQVNPAVHNMHARTWWQMNANTYAHENLQIGLQIKMIHPICTGDSSWISTWCLWDQRDRKHHSEARTLCGSHTGYVYLPRQRRVGGGWGGASALTDAEKLLNLLHWMGDVHQALKTCLWVGNTS